MDPDQCCFSGDTNYPVMQLQQFTVQKVSQSDRLLVHAARSLSDWLLRFHLSV